MELSIARRLRERIRAGGRGSRGLDVAGAVATVGRTEARSSPGLEPGAAGRVFAAVRPAHGDRPVFEPACRCFPHPAGILADPSAPGELLRARVRARILLGQANDKGDRDGSDK